MDTNPIQQAAALCQSGHFADARAIVAPLLDAGTADPALLGRAWHIAAVCALGLGEPAQAESCWIRAIGAAPDFDESCQGLGALLTSQRRFAEAERIYRALVAVRADHADAHYRLGNVLESLGRLDDADAAYRQALTIRPQFPEALDSLGGVLKSLGRFAEAELACRLALAVRPDYVQAHSNLGALLIDLKRLSEAEAACRQAIAHSPDHPEAHYNLGIALQNLDRLPEAEAAYRHAIRCRPDLVHAHNNLGCVLRALGREEDALASFEHARALRPALAEAHYNLGATFGLLGRQPEAEAAYRQALALHPDYGDACFGLAVLLLGLGRFDEGWRLYESRYLQPAFVHMTTRTLLHCPQWQGEALAGKSLLVWQEDGLGDMLQFGRYFGMLKARGAAHVAFACVPPLRRLMTGVAGVDAVLDHDDAMAGSSRFDCWTSLLSAPLHFRTTVETIPPPLRLVPEPVSVARWRARLDALAPGPRIGIVWKGNPLHHNDANRSLPSLTSLAPLWNVPGARFVSLQKGQGEDEARDPPNGLPLLHLGSEVEDLADTAAIVAQLDLVVCVDTSTAHLAASLGTPCWVLLPDRDVDWRWMHARDDSPWYPQTVRVFRRARGESWIMLAERVRAACAARFSAHDAAHAGAAGR
ncbi:Tetratricopeptide TPR_2 repeat-containing protein [Burkholderia multivorans]